MARTDIARVIARAVLGDVVDRKASDGALDPVVDRLLYEALSVRRRRIKNVGEVVELLYVVPPDPTTPED